MGVDWLAVPPLLLPSFRRVRLDVAEREAWELYRSEGTVVEIGHETVEDWLGVISAVVDDGDLSPAALYPLDGMCRAVALHGADIVREAQARLSPPPEQLLRSIVERHALFPPLPLIRKAAARDDALFFDDLRLTALKNAVVVLAALNGRLASTFMPRRALLMVDELATVPQDATARLRAVLEERDRQRAIEPLAGFLLAVIDLVADCQPGFDATGARERLLGPST